MLNRKSQTILLSITLLFITACTDNFHNPFAFKRDFNYVETEHLPHLEEWVNNNYLGDKYKFLYNLKKMYASLYYNSPAFDKSFAHLPLDTKIQNDNLQIINSILSKNKDEIYSEIFNICMHTENNTFIYRKIVFTNAGFDLFSERSLAPEYDRKQAKCDFMVAYLKDMKHLLELQIEYTKSRAENKNES